MARLVWEKFVPDDFCVQSVVGVLPGHIASANCRFRQIPKLPVGTKERLRGPGVYSIFYEGSLIYIGKYQGERHNPFTGNVVRLRWLNHIGSMTMRDQRQSYGKRTLDELNALKVNSNPIAALAASYSVGAVSSDQHVLMRDRGCQSTAPRARFASEHWADFGCDEGPNLSQFEFHYFRLEPNEASAGVAVVRELVSAIETDLVAAFLPRCNVSGKGRSTNENEPNDVSAEEVRRYLGASLGHDLINDDPLSFHPSLRRQRLQTSSASSEIAQFEPEPEEVSLEQKFEDRLGEDDKARKFIEIFRRYADRCKDLELHYTATNGVDLRLRSLDFIKENRGGQNFMTMTWSPRFKVFSIKTLMAPDECEVPHLLQRRDIDLMASEHSGPMRSTLKVGAEIAFSRRKDLLGWITKSRTSLG
jgi:hypothetical protein